MDGLLNTAPTATDVIMEATESDFEDKVLRMSMETPVIVDFWAPWCEPCKALTPILERLVRGANGAVKLVKLNIDENKSLAGQLGVQSIPMVYAFYQGQAVDGFTGNVAESQVKALIDKLITIGGGGQAMQDIEAILAQAAEFRSDKEYEKAMQGYAQILQQNPEHVEAIAGLLHCYIALGQVLEAEHIIKALPDDVKNHADIQSVQSMLSLRQQASEDLSSLAEAAKDESNLQALYDYACARFAVGEELDAMQDLLTICRKNIKWNEDAARLKLLEFFEALGVKDKNVIEARRQLSSLLFS